MNPARLSLVQAARVIARRDFTAVIFSRTFLFFLLGPLFPVFIIAMAAMVGNSLDNAERPAAIAIAMPEPDRDAFMAAERMLSPRLGGDLPPMVALNHPPADPAAELSRPGTHWAAIVSGPLGAPVITGPRSAIEAWQGPIGLIAAEAARGTPKAIPDPTLDPIVNSAAKATIDRLRTAQAAQTLLFMLTMLLAGMVLSNLVEEKSNKIIEILAAAIPMDAVFLGKLFAMLGVSLVGIVVWATLGMGLATLSGQPILSLPAPAVGWPVFIALGVAYFAMAYLLLGSIFLIVGAMAATVRDVQTLSMPVTMMQLVVFFFATFAMSHPGSLIEWAAIAFPFSSPFAMIARAARDPAIWPHLAALCWQALAVAMIIKGGAALFRRRVMKSGPPRRRIWRRRVARDAAVHR